MPERRVAVKPLDPDAVAAANAAVKPDTGGRPIRRDQAAIRRKWMDAYVAAGGAVHHPTPRGRTPAAVCETCRNEPLSMEVAALTYRSDHRTLRNEFIDWRDQGRPYPEPDWTPTMVEPNPVSHSIKRMVTVKLVVDVHAFGRPERGRVIGKVGGKVAFRSKTVTFRPGRTRTFVLRSRFAIVPTIRKETLEIAWEASTERTMTEWTAIGTTRSPEFYTTFGRPIARGERGDGTTVWRTEAAVEWISPPGTTDHRTILDHLFGKFSRYVLTGWNDDRTEIEDSTLSAEELKELEADPDLKKDLAEVGWPTYFKDWGAWPTVVYEEWGAECQAICRLFLSMLRQLGSRRDVRMFWVNADFADPETPLFGGVSRNPRTRRRQGFRPTGPHEKKRGDAKRFYTLADSPVELGRTYWQPKQGEASEVGWNNFEAYLRYRPTRGRTAGEKWYGGGVAEPIPEGSNPLHVFYGLVEYQLVKEEIEEGGETRIRYGRKITGLHVYRPDGS